MPETRAVTLANIASSDAFTVDNANDRVGIGSTVPDATLDIKNTVIVDGVAGVVTAVAFDGDGSRLTGVANTDVIVSSATTTGRLVVNNDATVSGVTTAGGVILKDTNIVAGVVTGSTFVGDGSGLTGVANTDVVHTREITASGVSTFSGTINAQAISGTSAAFTGNIDLNSDTNKLKLGAGDDFQLYHNGSNNFIETNNGDINITTTGDDINITAADDMTLAVQGGENAVVAFGNGPVELYYDNTERFQTNTDGVEVTHVATANTMRMFVGGSVGVGIGVTTTTGRDAAAGVGTVKGQIVYNDTESRMEVYSGNAWVGIATAAALETTGGTKIESGSNVYHVFTSDLGAQTFQVSGTAGISGAKVLIVGGGSGSNNDNGSGGAAGGVVYGASVPFSPGTYPARAGVGGSSNQNRDNDIECNGQPSRLSTPVGFVTGFGGQGSANQVGNPYAMYETWGSDWIMNPYGDNPDITPNTLFGSACGGRVTNPTSYEAVAMEVTTYGQPARPTFGGVFTNYGNKGGPATNSRYWNTGGGGGAGQAGTGSNPALNPRAEGGDGQPFTEFPAPVIAPAIPNPYRSDFESEVGPTGIYGGGGGGSMENPGFSGSGGAGGGGDGGNSSEATAAGLKGTYGTGGGSGSYGGGQPGSAVPEVGGPGIIIIKYST